MSNYCLSPAEKRRRYFAQKNYWTSFWKQMACKYAVCNGHMSRREYENIYGDYKFPKNIKQKEIPKYIKEYTSDEIDLIMSMLNKNITRVTGTFKESLKYIQKYERLYSLLRDEKNLRAVPTFRQIDEWDKKWRMTIKEFSNECTFGDLFDGAGHGYYGNEYSISNVPVHVSSFLEGHYRTDFKYVYWYKGHFDDPGPRGEAGHINDNIIEIIN